MEYKIDKIDVEVRQRVNEINSKDKIHGKKEIQKFELNIKDEDGKKDGKSNKKNSGKKIEIITNKSSEKAIKVDAVKDDNIVKPGEKGNFIDVRK